MRWLPQLPGMADWGRMLAWRRNEVARLGIAVETGSELDAAAVRAAGAELVVVATGAAWSRDGINGITKRPIPGAGPGLPHVLTPEQVVRDGVDVPGRRVVVVDCESYFTGPSVAWLLAERGHEVTLATPYERAAIWCDWTLEGIRLREAVHRAGVVVRPDLVPASIASGGAAFATIYGETVELEADAVVLATQRVSRDALWRELEDDEHALREAGILGVHATGDCVAPRWLVDAVFDGHRLGREIDSPDPDRPLPYRRERPLVR
jgi:dimethylamine/trimethylamine dehydrogenase